MVIDPLWVNLKAFDTRFKRTCLTLCSSRSRVQGTLWSIWGIIYTCFSSATIWKISTSSLTDLVIWAGWMLRLNFPFFIWKKSRRSFTKKSKILEEFWIIWRSFYPSTDTKLAKFWDSPVIAFRGVRMSCDTVAVSISTKCFSIRSFLSLIIGVTLFTTIILTVLFWKVMSEHLNDKTSPLCWNASSLWLLPFYSKLLLIPD